MRTFSAVLLVLILTVLSVAISIPSSASNYQTILFLHHSTGANLISQGNVRGLFDSYNSSHGTNFQFWDQGYNGDGRTDPQGNWYPAYDVPDDNTDPDGLAVLFAQPVNLANPQNALSHFLAEYKVFIFKSCFPAANIADDTQLQQYKNYYLGMRNVMDQYPDHIFIPMGFPPLEPGSTTPENAARARSFANWLKSTEYTGGHPNIYVFDFFGQLADSNNYLRAEYRPGDGDSHPNMLANQTVAPVFVNFIINSINSYVPPSTTPTPTSPTPTPTCLPTPCPSATPTPSPGTTPTPGPTPTPSPSMPPMRGSGYTLDGWGGVHRWGSAPALGGFPYWTGWDIARDVAIHQDGGGSPNGGWTLDGWGGIHNFGAAPVLTGPYWPGWDIARGAVIVGNGSGAYTLDGWGGLHPMGSAVPCSGYPYWTGWDIARGAVVL